MYLLAWKRKPPEYDVPLHPFVATDDCEGDGEAEVEDERLVDGVGVGEKLGDGVGDGVCDGERATVR